MFTKFICENCSKRTWSRASYYKHRKMCVKDCPKKIFRNCVCGKPCHSRTSFFNHKKQCEVNNALREKNCTTKKRKIKSPKKTVPSEYNFKCQEENCSFSCYKRLKFLNHLKNTHSIESCWENKTFQTYEEFEIWKEQFEKSTMAAFKAASVQKTLTGTCRFFNCNRSGKYVSKSTGKRTLKSRELTKIGFNCTACINVKLEGNSPIVKTTICKLHYGHDKKLSLMKISKSDRVLIANQLSMGINKSRIQRNMLREYPSELQRQHFVTTHDISNICKSYGINKIEKPSEDHMSIEAYVEEDLQQEKSIILFKRPGEDSLYYPQEVCCALGVEDFSLGIMTDFQSQMLKIFGGNIICFDASHGTNSADFKLITVLVVDEFKEVIPVAWLISNRESYSMLLQFFISLKKKVGCLNPKIIMTDKAPQYFQSWIEVFDDGPRKLMCHWHVHRDWQKNVNKIKDNLIASALYNDLCLILEEPNIQKFNIILENCKNNMFENEYTQDFAKYFETEWLGIEEEWAECYRRGAEIYTNVYQELFLKYMKTVENYLKEKHGKRVDKCLHILQQFANDLCIKRLSKLEEGDCNWKITQINKRHEESLHLPLSFVKELGEGAWSVQSEKTMTSEITVEDDLSYVVKRLEKCMRDCQVGCQCCSICLHSYKCSCPDALVMASICKHIHLVIRFLNANNFFTSEDQNSNEYEAVCDEASYVSEDSDEHDTSDKSTQTNIANVTELKSDLLAKTSALCDYIKNCDDRDLLLNAREHINSAISVLKSWRKVHVHKL